MMVRALHGEGAPAAWPTSRLVRLHITRLIALSWGDNKKIDRRMEA